VPAQTATQALTITLSEPTGSQTNAELNGSYAFAFNGIAGSGGGTFRFWGGGKIHGGRAGNLTNGELVTNGVGGRDKARTFTGTYVIGADNRGVMTLKYWRGQCEAGVCDMANGNAQFIEFDARVGVSLNAHRVHADNHGRLAEFGARRRRRTQ